MTRRLVLAQDVVRKTRRDSRFASAAQSRIPDPDWRAQGSCLGVDPEIFFPQVLEESDSAVSICRACPVAGPCLAAALDSGEVDGIWGATTPEERRVMRLVWTMPSRQPARAQ